VPERNHVDYETLAELRYQLRRFFRVRELAARAVGIEPQQYVLLLQLKGLERRGPVTIGALAERLQLRHHSTVELVDRLETRGMVARTRAPRDRRGVVVELRPAGAAILRKLALHSMAELKSDGAKVVAVLTRLLERPKRRTKLIAPATADKSRCHNVLAERKLNSDGVPSAYQRGARPWSIGIIRG
jgi:DNA-binding MarR family transcriptional regulator